MGFNAGQSDSGSARDKARLIVANITKLPALLTRPQY